MPYLLSLGNGLATNRNQEAVHRQQPGHTPSAAKIELHIFDVLLDAMTANISKSNPGLPSSFPLTQRSTADRTKLVPGLKQRGNYRLSFAKLAYVLAHGYK